MLEGNRPGPAPNHRPAYARARRGEIAQFTGISAGYEVPQDPALAIDTQAMDIQDCCRLILDRVRRHP